jgi:hypothetical protein
MMCDGRMRLPSTQEKLIVTSVVLLLLLQLSLLSHHSSPINHM